MDTNMTISDICAELREKSGDSVYVKSDGTGLVGVTLAELADRIESAAELERIELREDEAKMLLREYAAAPDESLTPSALELKRELLRLARAPGNAAALREALANVERVAKYCAETPRHTPGYPTDAARADVLYSRIAELGRVARAALSAPARNCDRFATVGAAHKAWRATDQERDFADWLFDKAEGGDHA